MSSSLTVFVFFFNSFRQKTNTVDIVEDNKDKLLVYFNSMFTKLNINAIKSFLYFCLGKNTKQNKKLLDRATQRLFQNLDVVRILTKLQEVDKLKELLLNKQ